MALINIEKRTRALATGNWSAWEATTSAPPYTVTEYVDYRAIDDTVPDIDIEDLTKGTITANDDEEYTWEGSGIFDKIVESVNSNIKLEYDNGRIVGQDYAATYLGGLQSALQTAVQLLLQKDLTKAQIAAAISQTALTDAQEAELLLNGVKDRLAKDEEIDLLQTQDNEMTLNGVSKRGIEAEQKILLTKQQALTERQAQGFDDDAKQKLLKQALDSWSVAYSVAKDANSIPDSIKVNTIDSIMEDAYESLGITVTNDPIGEA